MASAAVAAAQARRGQRTDVEVQWFIRQVQQRVTLHMRSRVTIAAEYLKSKVVRNISRPVYKLTGPRGGRVVTNRSKPGEFPKAETSQLMRTIFADVKGRGDTVDAYVGTPLDYGLILETSPRLDRSFLRRTFNEEQSNIKRILTVPVPGGK